MTARTCLVTGAGSGIGAAVAARLSAAGHRVALNGRGRESLDALAASLPGPALVVPASNAARHGAPYVSAYTAAKHGALGLVRSAAAELARTGVTVNAVCPGYVDTPMTARTVAGIVAATGRTEEQALAALVRQQPIGRLITPEEVADAVEACVRNAAITGQGINVDGGATQS